jgi:hypothetical protein
MTAPDEDPVAQDDATGETGALAAASRDDVVTDPLGPLDRLTEDDQDE